MKKYFLLTLYSLIHNGKNRKEILIRCSFFLTILYIFSQLWQATAFSDGSNRQLMIWYLSITELIILSVPLIQVDIENDIRSGDVVYLLLKPINYLGIKISESIGAFLFRFFVLLLISIPFCTYLSGFTPPVFTLCIAYLLAAIAGIVFIFFQTVIGLLAFKLQDAGPVFWIWQRCSFLFGGLLIPLDFYPSYLKTAAYFLPFASLLYAPAHLIFEFNPQNVFFTLLGLLFWGAVAVMLGLRLYVQMLKSLRINGG